MTHAHDWYPTGLWVDGLFCRPCREPGCTAALCLTPDRVESIRDGVFPMAVGGVALDIEDDPRGGVAKIVIRELSDSYLINQMEFKLGDVILDIGAHVGIVSCYIGKRWPEVRIYAFEPVPDNYRRLQRNLAANGVTSVRPFQLALTGNGRRVAMSADPAVNSGGGSILGRNPTLRVPSTTLTNVFAKLAPDRVALLKIDCEGAEYEVLTAGETLLDRVDALVGEFHDGAAVRALGYSPDDLEAMVWQHVPVVHVTRCMMGA